MFKKTYICIPDAVDACAGVVCHWSRVSSGVSLESCAGVVCRWSHVLELSLCEGSSLVEVDEAGLRVRPANKRCTVILREIPQDTKVEVIYPRFMITCGSMHAVENRPECQYAYFEKSSGSETRPLAKTSCFYLCYPSVLSSASSRQRLSSAAVLLMWRMLCVHV